MQHLEIARLDGGFEDRTVLDLFAGAGTLALEALSRGARHATLVDRARRATTIQRRNAESLACLDRCTFRTQPLPAALRGLKDTFDVVFADPPYDLVESFSWDLLAPLLSDEGILVAEHRCSAPPKLHSWRVLDTRRYGDTCITIATRPDLT